VKDCDQRRKEIKCIHDSQSTSHNLALYIYICMYILFSCKFREANIYDIYNNIYDIVTVE